MATLKKWSNNTAFPVKTASQLTGTSYLALYDSALSPQNGKSLIAEVVIAALSVADPTQLEEIQYQLNMSTTYAGSPEGNVRGKPGRICINTSASPAQLYSKDSGTGTTGWVIKAG